MMKKLISILIMAIMLLGCVTARAETDNNSEVMTLETAKKAVYTSIANSRSMDTFTDDGSAFDPKKFHPYSYYSKVFQVVADGEWTTEDGRVWSVKGLRISLLQFGNSTAGGFEYNLDVYFDGKNYILSGDYYSAAQWKYLYTDRGSHEIENPEWSVCKYLTISPQLLDD